MQPDQKRPWPRCIKTDRTDKYERHSDNIGLRSPAAQKIVWPKQCYRRCTTGQLVWTVNLFRRSLAKSYRLLYEDITSGCYN